MGGTGSNPYNEVMGDDASGPLLGWSLNSVRDASDPRPFDTLKFPCLFRFKAIGVAGDDLVEGMLARVSGLLGRGIDESAWSVRDSGAGRYVCLTLDLEVTSGQQVYDIYDALKEDTRVTHLL